MSEMGIPGGVVSVRSFVPASDLEVSVNFYREVGCGVQRLGEDSAEAKLSGFSFLLQQFEAPGFAGNYMMQLLVDDVDPWWERIASLPLVERYGIHPPKAPAMQPWGLRVAYVVDPSGVLWHIAQRGT
jgi:catechol 2,3-dioxygenase-like lactoylglutathione lyase family enzyme